MIRDSGAEILHPLVEDGASRATRGPDVRLLLRDGSLRDRMSIQHDCVVRHQSLQSGDAFRQLAIRTSEACKGCLHPFLEPGQATPGFRDALLDAELRPLHATLEALVDSSLEGS